MLPLTNEKRDSCSREGKKAQSSRSDLRWINFAFVQVLRTWNLLLMPSRIHPHARINNAWRSEAIFWLIIYGDEQFSELFFITIREKSWYLLPGGSQWASSEKKLSFPVEFSFHLPSSHLKASSRAGILRFLITFRRHLFKRLIPHSTCIRFALLSARAPFADAHLEAY